MLRVRYFHFFFPPEWDFLVLENPCVFCRNIAPGTSVQCSTVSKKQPKTIVNWTQATLNSDGFPVLRWGLLLERVAVDAHLRQP